MDRWTFNNSLYFALEMGEEAIALGGGEPTLHPLFFDFVSQILREDCYLWLATNGTITESMLRLAAIMDDNDWEHLMDYGDEEEMDHISNPDKKLSVALSNDWAHKSQAKQPTERVMSLWEKRFELRDVFKSRGGASAQGRAKKTGAGWGSHCVCNWLMVKPNGDIKPCGCTRSPVIGNVNNGGLTEKGKMIINDEEYQDYQCYFRKN
jgi:MoaA/NifB/PqqE/SkfB family radical SAM enzyme